MLSRLDTKLKTSSSIPVLVRPTDEPARRERRQQRLRTKVIGLQHRVRALRLHQPPRICLPVHNRQEVGPVQQSQDPNCYLLPSKNVCPNKNGKNPTYSNETQFYVLKSICH